MKEKRELITEKTFVLLDAEVYEGPHGNTAVFVMTAEKPINQPITREQVLARQFRGLLKRWTGFMRR